MTGSPNAALTPLSPAEVLTADPATWRTPAAPQPCPAWMEPHAHEVRFVTPHPRAAAWAWLNDPATFTDGQIPPFRVEFVSPDPAVPPGFHVGVLNTHHGPLLNFAGVLTDVRPPEYRDLHYYYGAYALSPRLIRPTRLQFWLEDAAALDGAPGTAVRLRVDSLVRRGWGRWWTRGQNLFWKRFPKWMGGALAKRARG